MILFLLLSLLDSFPIFAQDSCEVVHEANFEAYSYCPKGTTAEQMANWASENRAKYEKHGIANFSFYSDKSKVPRDIHALEKLSEKNFQSIELGYVTFNSNLHKTICTWKNTTKKKLEHCEQLLKW